MTAALALASPIGTRAGDLSAWDKLQLGWLDYELVGAGQSRTLDLGPHEYNSAKARAAVVILPDKTVTNVATTSRTRCRARSTSPLPPPRR